MAEFAGISKLHQLVQDACTGETRVGADIGETVKWQMEEGRGNHESRLYGSEKVSEQS